MGAERRLLSLHRRVAEGYEARHGALWSEMAEMVVASGAHAWRFVSASDPRNHLEFLEFGAANDPRDIPAVRRLLVRMDEEVAPATLQEWLETH